MSGPQTTLAVTAHPGDFVWRAGGALALAVSRGERAVIACLSFGERGESASQWFAGKTLDEVKAVRRAEGKAPPPHSVPRSASSMPAITRSRRHRSF